jgi:hypothetical protein
LHITPFFTPFPSDAFATAQNIRSGIAEVVSQLFLQSNTDH